MRESVIYQEIKAEGEVEGEARGRAEGEARGEERKALEIAQNMLKAGMSSEQVMQLTGLSAEQLSRYPEQD